MTYNVHSCKGRDRKVRPDRIAEVIAAARPDIVAIQEIRVGRVDSTSVVRTPGAGPGTVPPPVGEAPLLPPSVIAPRTPSNTASSSAPFSDQPRAIADALGMHHVFYPLVRTKVQDYGIALLSRHPIRIVRAANLPTRGGGLFAEKRGAIWAVVTVEGRDVQVIVTHFGIDRAERTAQVDALLGPDWMKSDKFTGPFVVSGDFNMRPGQPAYERLAREMKDGPLSLKGKKAAATWPSARAFFRIDHVFIPKTATALAADVPTTAVARIASDHLPLVVDVAF